MGFPSTERHNASLSGDLPHSFASRTERLKGSSLRQLLKDSTAPGVISLAGGLPAPEATPVAWYLQLEKEAITNNPELLNYGTTEPYGPLSDELIVFLRDREGIVAEPNELVVGTGSQQVIDILGYIMIEPGDIVFVTEPSYIGALQSFASFGAQFVAIPMKSGVLDTERFVSQQDHLRREGRRFALAYLVPDFDNPGGTTMTEQSRVDFLAAWDGPILEDVPYRELRYRGRPVKTLKQISQERGIGNVWHMRTFSKILTPDNRLGWAILPNDVRDMFIKAKQKNDLFTSLRSQATAAHFMRNYFETHIKDLIRIYTPRLKAMNDAIREHFPPEMVVSVPDGGFFKFVWAPSHIDMVELAKEALHEDKIAVVSGVDFSINWASNTWRLNFSKPTPEEIHTAIGKLGQRLHDSLSN